jgi:hypothetical protein
MEVAESAAPPHKGNTTSHVNWQRAVSQFTGDKYVLCESFHKGVDAVVQQVRDRTGNGSVKISGAVLAAFTAGRPVFTSVARIGRNKYGEGHIVAVFGTDIPANPSSSTTYPLAILNSAIKVGDNDTNACSLTMGDAMYRAEVYLTADYELKRFGTLGYSLMWLERKRRDQPHCVSISD